MANRLQTESEEESSKESDKMAKISKKALKSVVKDCLVEILQEGLMGNHHGSQSFSNADQISALNEHNTRSAAINPKQSQAQRRTGLDNISYGSSNPSQQKTVDESKIKAASQSLTSDPVLSSIFELLSISVLIFKSLLDLFSIVLIISMQSSEE